MSVLSYSQIEGYWIQAGGSRAVAPLMAAIAMAESSGNTDALNPNDNGGKQSSFGLWQISTGNHSAPGANWNDPLQNARLAVEKYNSQGLSAWGTYTTGAYKKYLQSGSAPVATSPVQGTVSTSSLLGGVAGDISGNIGAGIEKGLLAGLGQVLGPVIRWTGWLLQVTAGGIVMGVGAWLLIRESTVYQEASKAALEGATSVAAPEAAPIVVLSHKAHSERSGGTDAQ